MWHPGTSEKHAPTEIPAASAGFFHSFLKACAGSIEAARRAGTNPASVLPRRASTLLLQLMPQPQLVLPESRLRQSLVEASRDAWKNRLIDLSRRNDLLYYRPLESLLDPSSRRFIIFGHWTSEHRQDGL
jgi:hypothetical protein